MTDHDNSSTDNNSLSHATHKPTGPCAGCRRFLSILDYTTESVEPLTDPLESDFTDWVCTCVGCGRVLEIRSDSRAHFRTVLDAAGWWRNGGRLVCHACVTPAASQGIATAVERTQ